MTDVAVLLLSVALALLSGAAVGFVLGRRAPTEGLDDAALAAVDRSVHDLVRSHAAVLQQELRHVSDLVSRLRQERAEHEGRLDVGLRHTLEATSKLADTTQALREALASPKSRGQWGERMADDVLRIAGFVEGVNYERHVRQDGGTVPDYTFALPKGHAVHMDVKFPVDNYLRWLEADTDADRQRFAKGFRRDVRDRVRELTERRYIDPAVTLDYLLLFIPNESVYGFLHEHDPELIDFSLGHHVVLCSPTSLFAVLAVIRQAVDNFLVERQSDEILASVAGVREQWERFGDATVRVSRNLVAAQKALDELAGPRRRQFDRQLDRLEAVRDARLGSAEDGEKPSPLRQVR